MQTWYVMKDVLYYYTQRSDSILHEFSFAAGIVFCFINTNFYIGGFLILAELIYAYIAQLSEEYYDYCVGLMNSK